MYIGVSMYYAAHVYRLEMEILASGTEVCRSVARVDSHSCTCANEVLSLNTLHCLRVANYVHSTDFLFITVLLHIFS